MKSRDLSSKSRCVVVGEFSGLMLRNSDGTGKIRASLIGVSSASIPDSQCNYSSIYTKSKLRFIFGGQLSVDHKME